MRCLGIIYFRKICCFTASVRGEMGLFVFRKNNFETKNVSIIKILVRGERKAIENCAVLTGTVPNILLKFSFRGN